MAARFPVNVQIRRNTDGSLMCSGTTCQYGDTTLAAKSPAVPNRYSLHADLMFAVDRATGNKLVEHCIWASVGCEGVRDDRLPPSMGGLPPAEWPSSTTSARALASMRPALCSLT
jgi:hypothetical protein